MRLTLHTDYALRTLVYAGANPGRFCSISEIAAGYGISQNHLMKVVHELGRSGYLTTLRGRSGGVSLAKPPDAISLGRVIREFEADFQLADCGNCVIGPACRLRCMLDEASKAFMAVLDRYTLADVLVNPRELAGLFRVSDRVRCDGQ